MQRKDYYVILGIARDADEGEIKIAYRKLAFQHHPDTNRDDPQAEDRFFWAVGPLGPGRTKLLG